MIRPDSVKLSRSPSVVSEVTTSAQLLQPAGVEWGKREGRTGVDATRQLPVHA
jgi:hypothetical protein